MQPKLTHACFAVTAFCTHAREHTLRGAVPVGRGSMRSKTNACPWSHAVRAGCRCLRLPEAGTATDARDPNTAKDRPCCHSPPSMLCSDPPSTPSRAPPPEATSTRKWTVSRHVSARVAHTRFAVYMSKLLRATTGSGIRVASDTTVASSWHVSGRVPTAPVCKSLAQGRTHIAPGTCQAPGAARRWWRRQSNTTAPESVVKAY
mmetsp:Transcript_8061/g.23677  ORF Transcript_8061/g.23677 Transcript_8061/m.23677 type:complete len:204 (-) Transcript_8061:471-1082(-)